MRIVVSGASGLIGTALRRRLHQEGHDVVQLVRRPPRAGQVRWDPADGDLDPVVLEGADAVVNLGGAGIGDKRWTKARKRLILDSRVDGTALLARTIAALDDPKPVFLSASAIGIYGDRGDERLTEESPPGSPADDFQTEVTIAWEAAARPAWGAGARTALLRTGIVLDGEGGALGRMLLPFKLGIGGRIGSGEQWWSWIGLPDTVRAIAHLLSSDIEGPVNVTAPTPVTNAEFTRSLGAVLHRPTILPVPRLALSTLLGEELAESLVYTSAKVIPQKLLDDGFVFEEPELRPALEAALTD
jgi:uncharacterized protein (TIGR01777 family)